MAIRLASALFFASGAAALIFETLWFRRAGLAFGNSVWASALVLSSFMAGMALGNAVAARVAARLRAPLRVVAGLELTIAGVGLALVLALPLLGPALAPLFRPLLPTPWLVQPLRFATSFAVLLAPAVAMGATLPLLVHAMRDTVPGFGRLLGRLYGWNTLGAMTGALTAELVWIPLGGIYGATAAAITLNVVAAAGALRLSAMVPTAPIAASAPPARAPGGRALRLLTAAALCGALSLAFEVVWFRVVIQYLPNSSAMFAGMLAVVLAGIAVGSLLAARSFALDASAERAIPAVAAAACGLAIASHAAISGLLTPFIEQLEASRDSYGATLVGLDTAVWISATLMLPVSSASGALFTLLGKPLQQELGGAARAAGLLALCNSAGAAIGPLIAGFALLPRLGVDGATLLLASGYLVVAALAWDRTAYRLPAAAAAALAVLAVALFPHGLHERTVVRLVRAEYGAHEQVIAVREGIVETAIVTRARWRDETHYHRLVTDGYTMAGQTLAASRYMRAFAYLPAAFHPQLESALLISFGVGNTATALTELAELERIDVVDISPEILELAGVIHAEPGTNPLDDPRVAVHIEDGRYFLQTTTQRYDLVTAEPPPPAFAGVVNLYTREYFALIHDRLRDGGFASYWLPVSQMRPVDARAITRAFCDVFADCSLWEADPSDWILLGSRDASTRVASQRIEALWSDAHVGAGLRAIGFETPAQLAATFLADAGFLRDWSSVASPLVDAHPERAPAVAASWTRIPPEFEWIRDGRARAERFASGTAPGSLWPAELVAGSSEAFEHANFLRFVLLDPPRPIERRLAELHAALAMPDARAPIAWLLGSDAVLADAARRLAARGDGSPEVAWQLGVSALQDRDYAGAARHFGSAAPRPGPSQAALLEAYSLVRAGQLGAARAVGARTGLAEAPAFASAWRSIEGLIGAAGAPTDRPSS